MMMMPMPRYDTLDAATLFLRHAIYDIFRAHAAMRMLLPPL